jgi:TATA-box binding protein (TBP) (component of TFIID and TFIIIB)
MSLDLEWEQFLNNEEQTILPQHVQSGPVPVSTPIYISTNTIISYLNQPIDLKQIFWELPVISYTTLAEGIIKKQIKINNTNKEDVELIDKQLEKYEYTNVTIIQHIETETKYKDIRKITVGISKKDIISYRVKPKGAFYNCFVLILRIWIHDKYKEFHVKIFNTGKIEIPGIQDKSHLKYVIAILLDNLRQFYPTISYSESCEETVLINSNFNCGYFINRDILYEKLRYTYNISAIYDPCSYPGIQCKIYYTDDEVIVPTIQPQSVSFMVFRTGSILIVGKCSITVIHNIYAYLSTILFNEYSTIVDYHSVNLKKELQLKKFKKIILLS